MNRIAPLVRSRRATRKGRSARRRTGGPQTQDQAYAAVVSAWQHGELSTARLRDSAERIVALKRNYGILR